MKLGEKVSFCLPSAGRRAKLSHLIFIQPGAHLFEIPCMLSREPSAQREEDGTFSRSSPAGGGARKAINVASARGEIFVKWAAALNEGTNATPHSPYSHL